MTEVSQTELETLKVWHATTATFWDVEWRVMYMEGVTLLNMHGPSTKIRKTNCLTALNVQMRVASPRSSTYEKGKCEQSRGAW